MDDLRKQFRESLKEFWYKRGVLPNVKGPENDRHSIKKQFWPVKSIILLGLKKIQR